MAEQLIRNQQVSGSSPLGGSTHSAPAGGAHRSPDDQALVSGVSGVRGKVGQGLTPEVMTRLAAAHGGELLRRAAESHAGSGAAPRRVVIGRDSRTSGPMLRDAVAAGLQSVGCDVVDLGLAPTPTVLLAVRLLGAAGGLEAQRRRAQAAPAPRDPSGDQERRSNPR